MADPDSLRFPTKSGNLHLRNSFALASVTSEPLWKMSEIWRIFKRIGSTSTSFDSSLCALSLAFYDQIDQISRLSGN
jgi:hypothetical protein